jgi:hypothetical protein
MYILSKHRELSKYINIHEIAENFSRNLASNPPIFFLVENKNRKTTKTCYTKKQFNPSM